MNRARTRRMRYKIIMCGQGIFTHHINVMGNLFQSPLFNNENPTTKWSINTVGIFIIYYWVFRQFSKDEKSSGYVTCAKSSSISHAVHYPNTVKLQGGLSFQSGALEFVNCRRLGKGRYTHQVLPRSAEAKMLPDSWPSPINLHQMGNSMSRVPTDSWPASEVKDALAFCSVTIHPLFIAVWRMEYTGRGYRDAKLNKERSIICIANIFQKDATW